MPERDLALVVDGSRRDEPLVLLVDSSGAMEPPEPGEIPQPELINALRRLGPSQRDRIGRVVAVSGPGSYMGVRGGLAAGLGTAQALGCGLALVGTLEVVGAGADPDQERVLALADAGRGGTFGQVLEACRGRWRASARPELLARDAPWPRHWTELEHCLGRAGEGRQAPAGVIWLGETRDRRQALAWIVLGDPAPLASYDLVRAEYATPVEGQQWS
ncbi:MAG TPA: hypothetical protein VI138_08345 [Candidatus Dormibacteraeota bacterium]